MNILSMSGAWGKWLTKLYNVVVRPALRELYEERMDYFLPRHLFQPKGRLLDVGCGAGHTTLFLARRYPELELVGVDLSEEMLQLAREEGGGLANLSFQQGDAQQLPFRDNSFDLVMSLASIKHWPQQQRGVAELYRVLRPGGHCFLMEVDRLCSRRSAQNFIRHWRWLPPLSRPFFAEWFLRFVAGQGLAFYEMEGLCQEVGFVDVETTTLYEFPGLLTQSRKPSHLVPNTQG